MKKKILSVISLLLAGATVLLTACQRGENEPINGSTGDGSIMDTTDSGSEDGSEGDEPDEFYFPEYAPDPAPTEKITVSRYRRIESYDGEYIPLMECNSDPILLVKDVDNRKVALLNFSLHYSNIAILGDFPTLVFNMFEYFIPSTVKSNAFAVNENVQLNARGDSLTVSYNGGKVAEFTEKAADGQSEAVTFPVTMSLALPGTYELSQTTAFGKEVKEKVFVQIPSNESDIWRKDDTLPDLYREDNSEKMLEDLMFYIAAGMLLFLFIEWWLQSLDTM
jgi:hypothetical protein